ncbi:MAG: restriction endonuclease subunit S [Castellaniella sp.]|uniref:restriction endonuclease subunit S n=1 Tax=Castellaniella sp. TaxID=1955812 RepID=UPI003C730222
MNKHTAELLEQHFDTAFAASDGIRKLRELILTLAMQGKLAPQDPNDQPASDLLKEIEAEKQRLYTSSSSRKRGLSKSLPPVTEGEKPYALPQGWEWVRLGSVVEILDHLRKPVTKQDRQPGPYPYYGASGVVDYVSKYIFDEPLVLVGEDGAKWESGDRTAFSISGKTWVNNHAHVIRPERLALIDSFLVYRLIGMDLRQYITGMTVPKLNQARLVSVPIPLAPVEEQHRIVAKIDELMVRCDELEKLRSAQQEQRLTVHAAAIKQLLNIAEPDQHQRAQTFLAEHFGELYTVKENVAELRKAILQLAVMGKLVPQDPNDQPASELLKEIEAEKQRLVQEGKIKKPKPLLPVTEAEKPYTLPQRWEWVRFGEITSTRLGKMLDKSKNKGALKPYLRNTNVQWHKFVLDDIKEMKFEDREFNEFLVLPGDLLICEGGEPGRCAIWSHSEFEIYFQKAIHRTRPFSGVSVDYLELCLTKDARIGTLEKYFTGATIKHLPGDKLDSYVIPLPPFLEQREVITKVQSLTILCDVLDQQIDSASIKQTELLNALVHAQSQTEVEPLQAEQTLATATNLADYRAAIGCYTLGKLANAQYFGRTAAAKVLYLAQAHVGLELNLQPEREAAGPLDKWIYDFERQGQGKHWFEVNEKLLPNGRKKTEYRCLSALFEPAAKAESLMSSGQKTEFDRLIYALAGKTTEEVEIIATLFAVWNDFLIDGIQPSDEQIITDMRENWHERKGRFSPSDLKPWLSWLRKENFVPRGLLPRTTQQQRLGL